MMKKTSILFFCFIFLIAIFVFSPAKASAATITVNSLLDNGPGNCEDQCTLRDAIATSLSDDTIDFSVTGTIILTQEGKMVINKNLTIVGPGANLLSIDFNYDPIFESYIYHTSGIFNISDLTITNGTYPMYEENTGGALNISSTKFINNNLAIYIENYADADITITNCEFTGNVYNGDSGGAIDFNNGNGESDLYIINSIFFNNSQLSDGGAVGFYNADNNNLNITNSTFTDNSAEGNGGAIYYNGSGELNISNSTFTENTSSNDNGGAIYVSSGNLTVDSSTFDGNSALAGGAIEFDSENKILNIINSTFVNNSSTNEDYGIVVGYNSNNINTITNSTFYNNSVPDGYGILSLYGTSSVKNSIFALNTPQACDTATSGGHNITEDASCNFLEDGDLISTDPLLDPEGLKDNGGPVETIALLLGSPAINTGDDDSAPATDARGYTREGISDIGAYEYQTPTCSDDIQNQDETGIDIGGVCGNPEPEEEPVQRTTTGSSLAFRQNFLAQQQALKNQNTIPVNNLNLNPNTTPTNNLNLARNLKIKTRGNDVKDLQNYLNTKLNIKLVPDGIFGPLTRQAVIRFQLANGLIGDGIVGPLTRAKLK